MLRTASAVDNPFPGLRPFLEEERNLFFGREAQVDQMIDRLGTGRFLAVVGTSGSGKSSLVNCGFRPALRRGLLGSAGTSWKMVQFRPGGSPVRALAEALAQEGALFQRSPSGVSLADMVEATLRLSSLGLVEVYEQARVPSDTNLLVVVDQFEELFRYSRLGGPAAGSYDVGGESAAFVRLLLEAARQKERPIYIVLTMRSDFLGDCSQFEGLPEAINNGQYLIPRMTRDERRMAILGPVEVAKGEISPVLLTRLVNDVGDNPDQLSILQHALNRTWAYWRNQLNRRSAMSLEDYEAVGTMAQALDRHAERAYGELNSAQQVICERAFRALTDKSTDSRGIRRPVKLETLCDIVGATSSELVEVLAVFRKPSRSFLTPPLRETVHANSVIDISHESLMRIWERLRRWLNDETDAARDYVRLVDRANAYPAKAGLMRDPDLQTALDFERKQHPTEAWAELYGGGLKKTDEFLRMSEDSRDQTRAQTEVERRWQTRWHPLILIMVIVLYLISVNAFRASLLSEGPQALAESIQKLPERVAEAAENTAKAVEVEAGVTERVVEVTGGAYKKVTRFRAELGNVAILLAVALPFGGVYLLATLSGKRLHYGLAYPAVLAEVKEAAARPVSTTEHESPQRFLDSALAPWWRRLIGAAIDAFIAFGVMFIVFILSFIVAGYASLSDDTAGYSACAIWLILMCSYHGLAVGSRFQGTLGMLAVGVHVTNLQGDRISRPAAALREFMNLVLSLSAGVQILYGGVVLILRRSMPHVGFVKQKQGINDIISKSVVLLKGQSSPSKDASTKTPDVVQRHSGFGIASFVASIAMGLMLFFLIILAGIMYSSGQTDPESAQMIVLGLFIIGSLIAAAFGLTLGIVGLVQKNRRKVFAALGVAFNGILILSVILLMVIGTLSE